VPVDGGPGDAELGGDLGDGVQTASVGSGFLVHLLRDLGLACGEFGFLATGAAAGAGGGQAVEGALGHQGMLELGDGAEDLEEHPAHGGGRVDLLVEHDQVDAAVLKPNRQLDEVLEGSAESVEFGDDELIAAAVGDQQRLVEFGPAGSLPDALSMKICSHPAAESASCWALGFWSRVETRP
jgi:hypothetical protein